MAELQELFEIDELEKVWEVSKEKPVLLFKQSTTCPISAAAFAEFQTFLKSNEADIAPYFVKVRETREVSNKISEDLNVQHQSPQIFLVKNSTPVWNASHNQITVDSITEAFKNN
ncbi:MAG TPA: bacillithiol system redox-active protein YtxJ [Pseudogracilibacillus sp.]|nr:bacillithiol system redox-active protein YtxJ [Pseudogracilibacillus sp.]